MNICDIISIDKWEDGDNIGKSGDKVRNSFRYKMLRFGWLFFKDVSLSCGNKMINLIIKADKKDWELEENKNG